MSTTLIQNKPLYDGLKVTRKEYLDLEDDGFKYDMIDGVLVMSPSPFYKHGESQARLSHEFIKYFDKINTGKVINEVDVYLPDGEDVLRPDITIILKENYGIIKGHIHGVPDIVVEILSESTYKRDLGVKADRYLSNGVREYWMADPDEKNIFLWINDNKKSWNKKEGNHLRSSVLNGFILKQKDLFPE
jgi:Uma2 family endonuclease